MRASVKRKSTKPSAKAESVLAESNSWSPTRSAAICTVMVVTADSVNMTGECCATGRPVYVFTPSGGKAKFHRFHRQLEEWGATRPLPEIVERLSGWTYAPIDSTAVIAREIETRWLRRSRWLAAGPTADET